MTLQLLSYFYLDAEMANRFLREMEEEPQGDAGSSNNPKPKTLVNNSENIDRNLQKQPEPQNDQNSNNQPLYTQWMQIITQMISRQQNPLPPVAPT